MSVNLSMKYLTCADCGLTYGYPQHYMNTSCPGCLRRRVRELEQRAWKAEVEGHALRSKLRRAKARRS